MQAAPLEIDSELVNEGSELGSLVQMAGTNLQLVETKVKTEHAQPKSPESVTEAAPFTGGGQSMLDAHIRSGPTWT